MRYQPTWVQTVFCKKSACGCVYYMRFYSERVINRSNELRTKLTNEETKQKLVEYLGFLLAFKKSSLAAVIALCA